MLKKIEESVLQEVTGYFWNGFIFHLDASNYDSFCEYVKENMAERELLYVLESYNLKDVWWGSLAGMYLANITPPLVGFSSAENLLLSRKAKVEAENNQFSEIMEQFNVSNR